MSSSEPSTPEGIDSAARVRQAEALEDLAELVEEQNRLLEQTLRASERRRERTQKKLIDVLAHGGTGGRR